jgi:hypothetical protein
MAMISSGLLNPQEVYELSRALRSSSLFDPERRSYILYPDRNLPGFLERNVLDEKALSLEPIRQLLDAGRTDILETQADGKVRFAAHLANRADVLAALGKAGEAEETACVVADCYERLMGHREFTGRSGTMFGFEGLGCIYWHMVAKLLLAVQEAVFTAADQDSPYLQDLMDFYRDVRAGLGYKKSPVEYGAIPFHPYSHTTKDGGAQQPGMTGQVKEEILTRWGELGLRWKAGSLHFQPVLLDMDEIPESGALEFTYRMIPFAYRRGKTTSLRILTARGWETCSDGVIPLHRATKVEAVLTVDN